MKEKKETKSGWRGPRGQAQNKVIIKYRECSDLTIPFLLRVLCASHMDKLDAQV